MRLSRILIATLLLSMTAGAPQLDARGRTNNANANSRPSANVSTNRPGNNRPGNNNTVNRPGNNNWNNNNNRPGNNNWNNNNRPGNNNWGNNNRPVNPPAPPPPARPTPPPPPPRPHFPPSFHYYRPTPPPTWRPTGHGPSFNAILGIAFGTALNYSLNALMSSGYNVAGYGPSEIYLNNVSQFGYLWPNASLFYNSGVLVGSSFAIATPAYDMNRYNRLFSYFMGMYGNPIAVQNLNNGGVQSTWWGYNNNYVTLSYYPDFIAGGILRYYTSVTLGR